ncbi:glutathione S-transferase theta-1a [Salvelinus alpinus]|uniref:glutathione transferase n=1 Tax=Salvelinus namaycush TaxID=8040 RepID=A0A8U1EY39_SALNM|nr:glutathione S-transferase theta-1 [Salvelinus alpinus]XP_038866149.1 glutathione S-transferase theta-1a [Salvelinus namaycush]XP_055775380.1 glutathione S-transferase theta-1a [Salvelinus fontinalis]
MPLELYLDLHSQPCRSVFIFAKKTNIPFDFKFVDLATGQQYGEDFGKISVVRKVPVMRDGDFILTESVAILKYLAEKFGTSDSDHWYPADLQKRARVNEYLSWQHAAMRAHGSKVFWFRAIVPIITGSDVPKEKMDSAMEDLTLSLKVFEEKFLDDRPFIIGEKISLADLVAIVEIMQPVGTGLDLFENRPILGAWRDRVKMELGEALFDEAHKTIMDVASLPQTFENNGMLEFLKPKIQKMFN